MAGGLCNAPRPRYTPAVIRAVLFDFDGTLTRPGSIDFSALRELLGCPPRRAILEYIDELPAGGPREKALAALEDFELAAARQSSPNSGAEETVLRLARRGVGQGILSRNCAASIAEALKSFSRVTPGHFAVILSRESSGRPKPHPDGVHRAAALLGVAPRELLVVGDYLFDIEAGAAAGSPTVFLTNGSPQPQMKVQPDHVIARLEELEGILG
jgi:hydrogenase expression/formation protein HypE